MPAPVFQVVEGIEGIWTYHLSKNGVFTKSLCGKPTMTTEIPLTAWGTKDHLPSRWCAECAKMCAELGGPIQPAAPVAKVVPISSAPAEPSLPYQPHSDTSKAAAESVTDSETQRQKVLWYLEEAGSHGATDEEIQAGLGMPPNTQRPRRVELVQSGRVCDSGNRRRTASGRNAVVWITT